MSELKVNKISPATGTAFTLGDSGDTFTVPSGATFTNSGTATGFGGGKVLQCLSATKTDSATNNNATFTTISGLTVTITPSASSKVLVMWHVTINGNNGGSGFQIVRGSTAICIGDADGSRVRATGNTYDTLGGSHPTRAGQHLDDPSADGSTAFTYAVQWRSDGTQTDYLNRSEDHQNNTDNTTSTSNITVMEIGA
jgi:hypothetical protein|tara:strand:+ start:216 stop:806 length:591 start_codon:yes stop_codon:yes gene_type:complete